MSLGFKSYQPVGLRLWHWINSFAIGGLLLTVLLHKTFLSPKKTSILIQEKLTESNFNVDADTVRSIARVLRDRMFDWHYYFGFLLTGVFLFRIFVAIQQRDFPWRQAWVGAKQFRQAKAPEKRGHFHFTAVKFGYLTFYVAVLMMILTGLPMYFSKALSITRDMRHTLQDIHGFFLWYFVGFIVLHVAGVIFAELGAHRGIISNMIHGGEKKP